MCPITFHTVLILTVAAQIMSEPRIFKKAELQISWVKEKGPPEDDESESEEDPSQIEVRNVPSNVTENVLKAYFEMGKSGGYKDAVADCKQIENGIFTVTFHDPQGI